MKIEYSKTIYVMKFFAILSVIIAHVNIMNNNNVLNYTFSKWYSTLGTLGVVCFFMIAGFLYKREKDDSVKYWKNKIKTIIIPWIIATLVTYLMHVIKMHDFSIVGYFQWFIGYKTIYYYLTCYVLFLFLFKFIYDKNIMLFACLIITLIQSSLNTFGIYGRQLFFTEYLNIFNWIGFFAFGIIIRKYNILNKMLINKKNMILYIVVYLISSLYLLLINNNVGYFHIVALFNELSGTALIFYLSYTFRESKLLSYIGKCSFCIYLYHIQIVQKICWLLPVNLITIIINPFIGIAIMTFVIFIGTFIFNKLKINKQIYTLIGLH